MGRLKWWVVQFHCYIHVPDLKHISTYLTYLRYMYLPVSRYLSIPDLLILLRYHRRYLRYVPYYGQSSVSSLHTKVCAYLAERWVDTEIPAAVTFPQGARVNAVCEQDSLVQEPISSHYLLAFSSLSHPSRYGDSSPLRARAFWENFSSAPFIAISQGTVEVGVYR